MSLQILGIVRVRSCLCVYGCKSETTLLSVKLCTLIVMCMVVMIVETVDDIDAYMHREVADVVEGDLERAQVGEVRVAVVEKNEIR